jgi:hypothetical protein
LFTVFTIGIPTQSWDKAYDCFIEMQKEKNIVKAKEKIFTASIDENLFLSSIIIFEY